MGDNGVTPRQRGDWPEERVGLLEAVPELCTNLPDDERAAVERISVPVVRLPKGPAPVEELLLRRSALAAVVTEGLVLNELRVGPEPGLRVLGPGDVIAAPSSDAPEILGASTYRTRGSTRVALLGNDFLTAARHVPRLFVALQRANTAQVERLAAQLVICQLPRVADRVHAMLWLLADSYGRVTPAGTRLSLSLTHEVLGALVGARRPTVTLALGELATAGVLIPQDGGWLLLEPWRTGQKQHRILEDPELLDLEPSDWSLTQAAAASRSEAAGTRERFAELTATVYRLREQHRRRVGEVNERLNRLVRARQDASEVLRRVRVERGVTRRLPPSS
jgi:CRP/FNR family transcriptional regulator, cyclic AMP receptor protein